MNECEPLPVTVYTAARQRLAKVYPFQPTDQPVSPLAWLLAWADEAGYSVDRLTTVDPAWRQFLDIAMNHKTVENLRLWQRLPRDKNKWMPKVRSVVIGRWLFGLPLLLGVLLTGISLRLNTSTKLGSLGTLSITLVIIFCLGLLMSALWVW